MTNLKDKPFAVIGINPWPHEPGELKKAMTKEDITWRTFDVQNDNDINSQWNSPATPTFYIIDHKGTIRHKWSANPAKMLLILHWKS